VTVEVEWSSERPARRIKRRPPAGTMESAVAMITIDGSAGEGGGQVLRTALTMSLVTGLACRVDNIRGRRKKAGLLRQHLTAVEAATVIGDAKVDGAELGSRELVFAPRAIRGGDYAFAVGTAGSATLVLQTVLLPLMRASTPSTLTPDGGTHPINALRFLSRAFLPIVIPIGRTNPAG
jgi:RNA 3'-terminal phosphate cyclase (ATP)